MHSARQETKYYQTLNKNSSSTFSNDLYARRRYVMRQGWLSVGAAENIVQVVSSVYSDQLLSVQACF